MLLLANQLLKRFTNQYLDPIYYVFVIVYVQFMKIIHNINILYTSLKLDWLVYNILIILLNYLVYLPELLTNNGGDSRFPLYFIWVC